MIELLRQYWWAGMAVAAVVVVVGHAGLVRLVAALQEGDRKAAAARHDGERPARQ